MPILKTRIKYWLQKIFGFERYLLLFARFKIKTLHFDKKEGDFFFFLHLLPQEGTILDIGANIGIMAYHLADKRPKASVVAFEPIPQNFDVLKQIKEENQLKNIELSSLALGDKPGKIEMILPVVDEVKMQGLSHVKHESIIDFNEGEIIEVEVTTLDNFFTVGTQPITGIKIDVENFEYFALKGGEQLLKRDHPIVYAELWENENRQQVFDLMTGLGYTIYVVEKFKIVPWDTHIENKQNFIFHHGESLSGITAKDLAQRHKAI